MSERRGERASLTRRAALACLLAAACRDEPRPSTAGAPAAGAPPGNAPTASAERPAAPCAPAGVPSGAASAALGPAFAVQLAALADSARAEALRDSLAARGWAAYVREGGGATRWRVRVAPTADSGLARRVAAALDRAGWRTVVVRDSAAVRGVAARVLPLGGIVGMSARVRWALSPDGCALLAVHDPVGVENEPVQNAFIYAAEAYRDVVRETRVWDVEPAPDWRRLAFSRAWVLQGRERDSLTTAEWETVARETGTSAAAARAAAFPASGMAVAFGLAQPVVVDLAAAPLGSVRRTLPTLAGWQVRWRGSRMLMLGHAPEHAQDDAPSLRWTVVGADGGPPIVVDPPPAGAVPSRTAWQGGPTIDVSVAVPTDSVTVSLPAARVESRDGWVWVAPAATGAAPRVVGPGVALAATAGGRFILALAPKLRPREYEASMELVVYEVSP